MPDLDIVISQNGYARGWHWEVVVVADRTVVGRGIAATHAAARAQAQNYIELLQKTPQPPWKDAG
jgi:hypothetical protein